MNTVYDPNEREGIAAARESFSGRLLSNSQFEDFTEATKFVRRSVVVEGRWKQPLRSEADHMARRNNMKPTRAENILKDFFKAINGVTPDQMLKQLRRNFEELTPTQKAEAKQHVQNIQQIVEAGNKITFERATADEAASYALNLNITDAAAKQVIKENFEATHEQTFEEWGNQLNELNYKPVIEAEKKQRQAARAQGRSFSRRQPV